MSVTGGLDPSVQGRGGGGGVSGASSSVEFSEGIVGDGCLI